ncbi:unnamed protein product [Acanthoscelides obtectus]|uniref:Tetraspanin n=1 Tax=Acanthoscelides obtectus TaxID=200917 RepID=A0A9P0M3B2_ACAOB|nr:unnamed protein product [Acanthoscelides obtectus]CAK1675216.1 CD63 antigen [Acanthoscelides obtectus]
MCCDKKCQRKCNLFYVVLLMIIGIGQVAYGMYYLFYIYKTSKNITLGYPYIVEPSLSIVLVGIVLFSITTLGCCGFVEEVTCCISVYSIVLLILGMLQLLLTNFILFVIDDYSAIDNTISQDFKDSFRWASYYRNPTFVDDVQHVVGCCGLNSPADWKNFKLPTSCCSVSDVSCTINSIYLYTAGCAPKFTNFIMYHNKAIAYISGFLGSFEFLAAIAGMRLACSYSKKRANYEI